MRVLAGDIGGTKTLLCIAEVEPGAGPGVAPRVEILRTGRYRSREYPGLAEVIRAFAGDGMQQAGAKGPGLPLLAGFGVAGPVQNGRCRTTNLPWEIDARALEAELNFEKVALANDFVALAQGIPALPAEKLAVLQEGVRDPLGPCAVLGAGTGLGEAILVPVPGRAAPLVLATEGGHSTFAPRDVLESAIQRFLAERHGHVSWERLLSGDGLTSLVEAIAAFHQLPIPETLAQVIAGDRAAAPPLITEAARKGEPICTRALNHFCALYGSEAGNLALKCLPSGGVFVAGGIAPRILAELRDGRFLEAYRNKGRMRPLLEAFPVHVVLDGEAALLGAALLAAG